MVKKSTFIPLLSFALVSSGMFERKKVFDKNHDCANGSYRKNSSIPDVQVSDFAMFNALQM